MTATVTIGILLAAMSSGAGVPVGQANPASATPTQTPSPPTVAVRPLSAAAERAVRLRVAEWWTARERRDHQRMYALFEPAYRKKVPFADFLKESAIRTRFDLADTRVESVVAEAADRVRVKVSMETRPPRLPIGHVTAEDTWVRVSGQWYKVHEDVPPPFPTKR
jgi:hypothetical protein